MLPVLAYQDDVDMDSSGRPTLPNFKEQECPSPNDYQDVRFTTHLPPQPLPHPIIRISTCPSSLHLQMIRRCWSHSPLGRPSFDVLRKNIQHMNPNKESPVDMMMSMVRAAGTSAWCCGVGGEGCAG